MDTFSFRESLEAHTDAGLLGLGETYNGCSGHSYARTRPRVAIGDGKTPMPEGGAS